MNITAGPNQGMHNVVFVATQHDQLYAYDSDAAAPTLLWQRSFLSDALNTNPGDLLAGNTGVTPVPQSAVISSDITVEIGITGTPVIDPNTGTLYLDAKTAETVGGTVTQVMSYQYDVFGNLVGQTQTSSGTVVSDVRYAVDGWDTAEPTPTGTENFNDYATLVSSGSGGCGALPAGATCSVRSGGGNSGWSEGGVIGCNAITTAPVKYDVGSD